MAHSRSAPIGISAVNIRKLYEFDGLHTVHHARFRDDPQFNAAWEGAFQATGRVDPGSHWRIHIGLWAASLAARADGDFVECGVNAGFLSSAIVRFLDWNRLGRRFYLVDTFTGPLRSQYSGEEIERGNWDAVEQAIARGAYATDLESVRKNYDGCEGINIVQGSVPEVLSSIGAARVAFLHLDMNVAYPETQALRFFWERISPGGIVLMDDYAYFGYEAQGDALEQTARELGASILVLPTGQGICQVILLAQAEPRRYRQGLCSQSPASDGGVDTLMARNLRRLLWRHVFRRRQL